MLVFDVAVRDRLTNFVCDLEPVFVGHVSNDIELLMG